MAKSRLERIIMIQDSRTKTIGFTVFTIIVILVLVAGAITPSVSTIIRINKEIKDKEAVLTKLEDKVSALSALSQEYDSMESIVEDLPLIYPHNGDYSLVTANIEAVVEEYDFSLNAIGFLDDKSDSPEGSLVVLLPQPVAISMTGPVANFVPLLTALEDMPMNPEIRRVAYTYSPDADGLNSYSLQLFMYRIDDGLFYD